VLKSTLYLIIVAASFGVVTLSLTAMLIDNIEKYEAQEEYLEEYKQWGRDITDYSDNLKLKLDSLTTEKSAMSEEYDSLYNEYENLLGSKQAQQRELKAQEKQVVQLERAQIEEMAKTNPLIKGFINGKLRFYIEQLPYYAAPGVEKRVQEIADSLEGRSISQLKFERVYDPNYSDLYIAWVKNYGSHTLGEAIFKAHVKIGLGADNCYGDWQAFDGNSVMKIMWHEIGHSMGFGHSDDPNNVMYDKTDTRFDEDYTDSFSLTEGYYRSIPFCNSGAVYYEITSDDKNNGFDVYVLPPDSDPQDLIDGTILSYVDCGAYNMVSYSNDCNVADGAALMIYNKNDFLKSSIPIKVRVDLIFSILRIFQEIVSLSDSTVSASTNTTIS